MSVYEQKNIGRGLKEIPWIKEQWMKGKANEFFPGFWKKKESSNTWVDFHYAATALLSLSVIDALEIVAEGKSRSVCVCVSCCSSSTKLLKAKLASNNVAVTA